MTFDLDYNDYVSLICNMNGVNRRFNFSVDTQADISIVKFSSLPEDQYINTANVINIRGITQDSLQSLGIIYIELKMNTRAITHDFHVVPDEFNIDSDGILGKDFLTQCKCRIDYSSMTFSIFGDDLTFIK